MDIPAAARITNNTTTWIFLSCILVLSGCAGFKPYTLKEHTRDPEFNLLEILATGIVFGGVTSNAQNLSDAERADASGLLESILLKHSIYAINTPIKLSERVSAEKHNELLEQVRTSGSISVEDATELKDLLYPARYILFVSIEKDGIEKDTKNVTNAIEYIVSRKTGLRLTIFSTKTRQPAILSSIETSTSRSNRVEQRRTGDNFRSVMQNVVNHLVLGGFPEPPSRMENLQKLFMGVAEQIPKK